MLDFTLLYFDFFCKCTNNNERNIVLQGSSRSGKTYSVLMWFAFLAEQGVEFKITIVGRTYDFLKQGAYSDLKKIIPGKYYAIEKPLQITYKKATFYFKNYADEIEAKGGKQDYAYFNECNDIPKEIVDQVSIRTSNQCYFDFNPTEEFWIKEKINKNNFLDTTWKDNKHNLPQIQIDEFEQIKKNAEKKDATNYEKYFYQVYYLGKYGNLVGNVFTKIHEITEEEYNKLTLNFRKVYGIDFGYSNDPCTIVEVSIFGKKIFIKECYYQNETNDFQLAEEILIHCKEDFEIICDFGGGGDARMSNLHEITGKSFVSALKGAGSIKHGILLMQGYDIYICGENANKEFKGYKHDGKKYSEKNNHIIDPSRYAVDYIIRAGINQ